MAYNQYYTIVNSVISAAYVDEAKGTTKMKRIVSMMLLITMLFMAFPCMADNVRTSGDFKYTVKGNGTATIVGYTGIHTDIILPNMIDGYVITTIGQQAFAPAANTKREKGTISITLPDTITTIEKEAFIYRSIRTINIPQSLEYIDGNAFSCNFGDDGNMLNIQFRIPNNHPHFAVIDGSLYYKDNKELIYWAEGSSIPHGITTIAANACMGDGIITIPSSVASLGDEAFSGLIVEFEENSAITEIPNHAFSMCSLYNPPATITKIGEYAFSFASMRGETLNTLLQNAEEIGDYAFTYVRLEAYNDLEIVIPSSLKTISMSCFANMKMKHYHFEFALLEGVERIEAEAFHGCNIESIYLPRSLKFIAENAFDKGVQFIVEKGSYAKRWADENAYPYTINGETQDLEWLFN